MIADDPISFGGYLADQGGWHDVVTLCATLMQTAGKLLDQEKDQNLMFAAMSTAGLILLGATLIILGPSLIAFAAVGAAVAGTEAIAYGIKEAKYAKKRLYAEVTGAQTSARILAEEGRMQIFEQTMKKRLEYLDKEEEARFWKFFNMVAGAASAFGGALSAVAGHTVHQVGNLSATGHKIVEIISKGGPRAKRLMDSFVALVESGDKAMHTAATLAMAKDPTRVLKMVSDVAHSSHKLHKLHTGTEMVEAGMRGTEALTNPTLLHKYSGKTLKSMEQMMLALNEPDVDENLSLKYADLPFMSMEHKYRLGIK